MAKLRLFLILLGLLGLIKAQNLVTTNINITPANNNVSIQTNATAQLKCTASNWDLAAQLHWRRKTSSGGWQTLSNHGVMVSTDSRFGVKLSSQLSPTSLTSLLTIRNVQFDDAGSYQCEATINGASQAASDFTLFVFENGTGEILPMSSLRLSKYRYGNVRMSYYKTAAHLAWSHPKDKKSDEFWFYTIHLKYVYNRRMVTKEYKVPKSNGMSTSYQVNDLEPCTDYKAWVTGYSQRCKRTSTRRSNYQYGYRSYHYQTSCSNLVPGVYRRAKSESSFTFMTLSSVPLKTPKLEDIDFSARAISSDNCSAIVKYNRQHEPFGCPTQGLFLNVSTPETWPKPRMYKSEGMTVTLTGLSGDLIYPASLSLYNKYGPGNPSETFFLECHKVVQRVTVDGNA